jgi:hypothetical protein
MLANGLVPEFREQMGDCPFWPLASSLS